MLPDCRGSHSMMQLRDVVGRLESDLNPMMYSQWVIWNAGSQSSIFQLKNCCPKVAHCIIGMSSFSPRLFTRIKSDVPVTLNLSGSNHIVFEARETLTFCCGKWSTQYCDHNNAHSKRTKRTPNCPLRFEKGWINCSISTVELSICGEHWNIPVSLV